MLIFVNGAAILSGPSWKRYCRSQRGLSGWIKVMMKTKEGHDISAAPVSTSGTRNSCKFDGEPASLLRLDLTWTLKTGQWFSSWTTAVCDVDWGAGSSDWDRKMLNKQVRRASSVLSQLDERKLLTKLTSIVDRPSIWDSGGSEQLRQTDSASV